MTDIPQDAVFAMLAEPRTHGGAKVVRFDTHAASVFLAGDRAYKVKRAVQFPFLDYSTLQKRKAACLAELEVNCAFAPALREVAAQGLVPVHAQARLAPREGVVRRDEEPRAPDDLRVGPGGGGDHRRAAGHGLERRQAEALVARGHQHRATVANQ